MTVTASASEKITILIKFHSKTPSYLIFTSLSKNIVPEYHSTVQPNSTKSNTNMAAEQIFQVGATPGPNNVGHRRVSCSKTHVTDIGYRCP